MSTANSMTAPMTAPMTDSKTITQETF